MSAAQIASVLKKFRSIAESFPQVTEGESHGHPIFCVGKESFAALEIHAGVPYLALRVGPEDFVEGSRETRALTKKHALKEGWVLLKLVKDIDWEEVKGLLLMSYVSVAPTKMLQALDRTLGAH